MWCGLIAARGRGIPKIHAEFHEKNFVAHRRTDPHGGYKKYTQDLIYLAPRGVSKIHAGKVKLSEKGDKAMKYEVIIIWADGIKESYKYATLEEARICEDYFHMAFGGQITFTGINSL